MKRLLCIFIAGAFLATPGFSGTWANDHCDSDPLFERCYCKKKPFCFRWPNLAICLNACSPYPEVVGSIEWCRRSYTRMDVDECGRTIQYRATDITYRYVLSNGAYGECFTRTQRDGPITYPDCSGQTGHSQGAKVGIFK